MVKDNGFKYYRYDPSLAAAVIFATLFLLTSLLHVFQLVRARTWYFTPLVIGGVMECLGYIGRILSSRQSPNWTLGPFIIQSIFLLVAPAMFAASIYMVLGRIIVAIEGEKLSLIKKKWLTKIFVAGDVLSFLVLSSGMRDPLHSSLSLSLHLSGVRLLISPYRRRHVGRRKFVKDSPRSRHYPRGPLHPNHHFRYLHLSRHLVPQANE